MYPYFYFVPEDVDIPLRWFYKTYYFELDINSQRTDRLFLSNAILLDDLGWITQNVYTKEQLGGVELKSEISYYDPNNNYGIEGNSSSFYSLVFYMKKEYTKWNRSFMKLQDFAAIIGGLMKIIVFIGNNISFF